MERQHVFRDLGTKCLLEPIEELLLQSEDYRDVPSRAPSLFLLADRLDVLFDSRNDLGNASKLSRALSVEGDEERRLDGMLQALEGWLKAAVSLVNEKTFAEWEKRGKRHNLWDAFQTLQLLSKHELDTEVEQADTITCPIRRAMLDAKELRNPETHNCEKLSKH